MDRALLIVNPAARRGAAAADEVIAACAAVGIRLRVARTSASGDAARIAVGHTEHVPILVLGGDGTVMEVAGATVGRNIPIGVVPGGTGNQLARHLGIPLQVSRAVRALASAEPVRRDLGRLGDGRYFVVSAGFGLDAAMIAGASSAAKRRFGVAAYVWSGIRALARARPFRIRIEADGHIVERDVVLAMVANLGSLMAGRIALGPDVRADDGWLDVCVYAPQSGADALALLVRIARRDFRADRRMLFLRARHIRLEAPQGVPAQVDGDLLAATAIDAEVVPGGVTFLAPRLPPGR